jgi:hypothetical protein
MSSLVELAKDILRQAESLEKQLQDIDAPQPSLEESSPWRYPSSVEHPGIWITRESIATMSKSLLQLSLGPADMIRYMVGKDVQLRHLLVVNAFVKVLSDVICHYSKSWTTLTFPILYPRVGQSRLRSLLER